MKRFVKILILTISSLFLSSVVLIAFVIKFNADKLDPSGKLFKKVTSDILLVTNKVLCSVAKLWILRRDFLFLKRQNFRHDSTAKWIFHSIALEFFVSDKNRLLVVSKLEIMFL